MVERKLKVSLEETNRSVAPLTKRFLAYFFDYFLLSLTISLPFYFVFVTLRDSKPFFEVLCLTPLIILYFTISEKLFNASLGKLMFRLKVKSLEGNLEWWQTIVRNITKFSPLFLALDTINCFLSDENQRFSERVAKTQVNLR